MRCELRNRLDKIEAGANRALSIMFMRLGVAEIGENAVSPVLGDEATMVLNQFGAAAVIGSNDASEVLGVEPSRHRRRTHQVAKHDGELAAFGLISPSYLGRRGCLRCRYGNRSTAEIADRAEHFQSVPKSDAEIFEMLLGQIGKNENIDLVFGKTISVLGHAELFEPVRNLLHRGYQGRGRVFGTAIKSVPLTAIARLVKKQRRARPGTRSL